MLKRITALSLAAALSAVLLTACGGGSVAETTAATAESVITTTEPAETEPEYVYPTADYDGAEVRILNMDEYWGMYVTIAPEELNGEALNDAVYERNSYIEQKFDCVISDLKIKANKSLDTIIPIAQKVLLAGDDTYDVMYLSDNRITNFITEGYFCNLYSIPELQLDRDWWDTAYNSSAQIGENLYSASGDVYLMSYDSSWCLFFNENILENNGLDMPYDTVREGSWTLDELYDYCKAVANLNSDSSYKWSSDGAAVYGLVTHPHAPDKFIFSSGEKFVVNESGSTPYFAADNERFYGVVSKLAKLLGTEGVTLEGNSDDFNADRGYVYTFYNSRAAFLTAEIKAAQLMRDMDETFGIVPFPKYDENQEGYHTSLMSGPMVMTIPVTNSDVSRTATIMDALCYQSYKDVIPVYFDTTVSQKGLRNEDSVDMLQIMRSTRGADIAVVYDWNSELVVAIRAKLFKGDDSVTSDIAKYGTVITEKINELMEAFNK